MTNNSKNKKEYITVKVWQSITVRDAAERKRKQNTLSQEIADLSKHKKDLLAQRQAVSGLAAKLCKVEELLQQNNYQDAIKELIALSKNKNLERENTSADYLCGLFYIYKHAGLTDKLLDLSESLLKKLDFVQDNYIVLYDIAIYHEQYGDPGTAKHIYKMFIDNMELAYKDVAERYKNI